MDFWTCKEALAAAKRFGDIGATSGVISLLLLAWFGAFFCAPFVSRAYRRYVERLMRMTIDEHSPGPSFGKDELAEPARACTPVTGTHARADGAQRTVVLATLGAAAVFAIVA